MGFYASIVAAVAIKNNFTQQFCPVFADIPESITVFEGSMTAPFCLSKMLAIMGHSWNDTEKFSGNNPFHSQFSHHSSVVNGPRIEPGSPYRVGG
jgi:hypothetical protein